MPCGTPSALPSRHAPVQGAGRRPAVDQARRSRQDRDHPHPGLRQGPRGGQGRAQDDLTVRSAAGTVHPCEPDALPGPGRARHGHAGGDRGAAPAHPRRPRAVRRRPRRWSRPSTRWPRSTSGTRGWCCCCSAGCGRSTPARPIPRRWRSPSCSRCSRSRGSTPPCALRGLRLGRVALWSRRVGRRGVRRRRRRRRRGGLGRGAGPSAPPRDRGHRGGGRAFGRRRRARREARGLLVGFTEYHLERRMKSVPMLVRTAR